MSYQIVNTTAHLIQERLTTGLALGAIATPVWLPKLEQVSTLAGQIAPILGVVWLAVQIVAKLREMRKGK